MICCVDNTQAIAAAKKGYSKRLRHLGRTQRVSIGFLNDCIEDGELQISIIYVPTKEQKADVFTKAMTPGNFIEARRLIDMVEVECDKK